MTIRIGVLALVAVVAASSLACKKPGEREQIAEGRANRQADEAQGEANRKAAAAQAEADEKVAAARADFEKAREDYRHERQNDLADLDRDIATLDARAKTATMKAKSDLDAALPGIHAQRDGFVRDMKNLDVTSPATWDASRERLDGEWNAVKANVNHAL